jgi:ribosome biogenesis GTPase
LRRQDPGLAQEAQGLVANVDMVFVVMSTNKDFNLQRLLRYDVFARGCGARMTVVLSKVDLDPARFPRRMQSVLDVLPDREVIATSAVADIGIDDLRAQLAPGQTAVFLGSSGTGKSTLVNTLLGREVQSVQTQRKSDDRGRHTTTRRELFVVPGLGVIVDTPGLRALRLWGEDGLGDAFADIDGLADTCRFRDCQHDTEPGCAVLEAVESGELSAARLKAWDKLQREVDAHAARQATWVQRQEAKRFARMIRSKPAKNRW